MLSEYCFVVTVLTSLGYYPLGFGQRAEDRETQSAATLKPTPSTATVAGTTTSRSVSRHPPGLPPPGDLPVPRDLPAPPDVLGPPVSLVPPQPGGPCSEPPSVR
jgi:hypothetical protein